MQKEHPCSNHTPNPQRHVDSKVMRSDAAAASGRHSPACCCMCRPVVEVRQDYASPEGALSAEACRAATRESVALRAAIREHGLPLVVECLGGPLAVLRLATLTLGGCLAAWPAGAAWLRCC